jgi:hypothetical protein
MSGRASLVPSFLCRTSTVPSISPSPDVENRHHIGAHLLFLRANIVRRSVNELHLERQLNEKQEIFYLA